MGLNKQWVQHVSGQGEKWEALKELDDEWVVRKKDPQFSYTFLPKSEYRLSAPPPPPEQWVDVTGQCRIDEDGPMCQLVKHDGEVRFVTAWNGRSYRLRKVRLYQTAGLDGKNCEVAAFIIEKKVSS